MYSNTVMFVDVVLRFTSFMKGGCFKGVLAECNCKLCILMYIRHMSNIC